MKPFYEFAEAERIALTEQTIASKHTLHNRWHALGEQEAQPWLPRSEKAAALLGRVRELLDLGCGTMGLEQYAQTDHYIPSDVTMRDERTIVRDYNQSGPPPIAVEGAAVLGLLEYLHDPLSFMHDLKAERAVVSYCTTDAPAPLEPRRAHAWVNDMSTEDVTALMTTAGWSIMTIEPLDDVQSLWLVARTDQWVG